MGRARLDRSLPQRAGSLHIKRLLWIKESQISQVKEFRALFYVSEDTRVWAYWIHSFHMNLSYLVASILCFLHSELSWAHLEGVAGIGWLWDCQYSPSWLPLGLRNSHWKAEIPDDCDAFVCWYGSPFLSLTASLVAQRVKRFPTMWETWVRSLGQKDPLEKEMATHSSTLAWKIPWTEKPSRLQSMRSQRVKHNWVTKIFTHSLHWVDSKEIIKIKCKEWYEKSKYG